MAIMEKTLIAIASGIVAGFLLHKFSREAKSVLNESGKPWHDMITYGVISALAIYGALKNINVLLFATGMVAGAIIQVKYGFTWVP